MTGKLTIYEDRWGVEWHIPIPHYAPSKYFLQLHPTYEKYYFLDWDAQGEEVEFEKDSYWDEEKLAYVEYAKLVKRKNDYTLNGVEEFTISNDNLTPNSFTFHIKNEPVIVIDETGFKYKGELIEDAGEVYNLFKEYLKKAI